MASIPFPVVESFSWPRDVTPGEKVPPATESVFYFVPRIGHVGREIRQLNPGLLRCRWVDALFEKLQVNVYRDFVLRALRLDLYNREMLEVWKEFWPGKVLTKERPAVGAGGGGVVREAAVGRARQVPRVHGPGPFLCDYSFCQYIDKRDPLQ